MQLFIINREKSEGNSGQPVGEELLDDFEDEKGEQQRREDDEGDDDPVLV
jgi:hypothetical protein